MNGFHCKSRASIGSKLHYFQPGWCQGFSVAWLIILIWSDLLSLQELCFHEVQAALLPASLVSEVFCGLDHHAGKKWLAFTTSAVRPLGPSLIVDYCFESLTISITSYLLQSHSVHVPSLQLIRSSWDLTCTHAHCNSWLEADASRCLPWCSIIPSNKWDINCWSWKKNISQMIDF